MERSAQWVWASGFAAGVALVYCWLDDFSLIRMTRYQLGRTDIDNPGFNAVAFAGPYLLGLLSLALLHGHGRKLIRYPTYVAAVLSIATFVGFSKTSGRGFTITEASRVWSEIEFAGAAVQFFFRDYAPALVLALVGVAIVEWLVRRRLPGWRGRWLLVLPAVAAFMFYRLLVVTDAKVDPSPVTFRVPVLLAYAFEHQSVYLGARDGVELEPSGEPIADHIVLLIDESIRGDLMSLNGADLPTTPYLESIAERLFNYGVMSSIANLSGPAHIILQSGLRPDELPDTELHSMKRPLIFSYLKRAGFRTYLINAQNALVRPPNFMTDRDVDGLDGYIQVRNVVDGLEEHEPDPEVIPLLQEILSEGGRSFTYVVKNGAHFPYTRKFPPDVAPFDAKQFRDSHPAREARTIAQYLNTVHWSADAFLETLLTAIGDREDTLVIYTADHGQSLYESLGEGERPIRGHGHADDPPSVQARVPLLFIPIGDAVRERVSARYHASLRDRVSAWELFPSLLLMAGYAAEDVRARFHHSLFDPDADRSQRLFVSGNHFGADGPLYRSAPYRSSFQKNVYDPSP